MIYYETNYLAHHGVKGMKWGVRKRKPVSGLTDRQQRRYVKIKSKYDKKIKLAKENLDYKKKLYEDSKRQLNDLLKNGKKSDTFMSYAGDLYVNDVGEMTKDWKEWVNDNRQNVEYGKEYIVKLKSKKNKALEKYGG